jgi:predicted DNA-binding transcriptional regulator AlpA
MGYLSIKQLKEKPTPRQDGYARPIDAVMYTGLSISTIRRMGMDGKFPQKVKLGERSVGYRWSDLHEWAATRHSNMGA